MYRLPFELTDSAKLLHFTILGGSADPRALNDATDAQYLVKTERVVPEICSRTDRQTLTDRDFGALGRNVVSRKTPQNNVAQQSQYRCTDFRFYISY